MYEKLTAFLPRLQNSSLGTWIHEEGQFPYVDYEDVVHEFEQEVYNFLHEHAEMNISDYRSVLDEAGVKKLHEADVSALDGRVIMAMIIRAIRSERFCDGALLGYLNDGSVEKWLKRLQDIDGQEGE